MAALQQCPIPEKLARIPDPPQQLWTRGEDLNILTKSPCLAVIGSRAVTLYGRQVTSTITRELAARGIVIISGLAFGVDSVAHQAALDVKGITVAVLPSPIDYVCPRSHQQLADAIVSGGGALVSEYASGTESMKHNYIGRNRLVAGLADAILITEAAEKSGSLHTARFALEQGKDVLVVPGNITSSVSVGTNNLLKAGAIPVTSYLDVLHALNLEDTAHKVQAIGDTPQEQTILDLIASGVHIGASLFKESAFDVQLFNQTLTMLEIKGKIRALGSNAWTM